MCFVVNGKKHWHGPLSQGARKQSVDSPHKYSLTEVCALLQGLMEGI